ncbi:hypothetical protein QW131_05680 [Roseibium salinum]|nr:hypothetical protein [Roseibium salinum]
MRLWSKVGSADLFRALAVCAVFVLPAADASAASCSSLQAELRRLESGSASQSPAAQKWTSAKARQQEALTAAQRDAGYLGCANSSTPECKSLNGKIKQMKTNLAAIERQLAKSGGGSSASTGRLRQIKASLASQNCNAPARAQDARSRTDEGQPRSLLSRLFRRAIPTTAPNRVGPIGRPRDKGGAFATQQQHIQCPHSDRRHVPDVMRAHL